MTRVLYFLEWPTGFDAVMEKDPCPIQLKIGL